MSIRIASGLALGALLAWFLALCACALLVIFSFARLGGESNFVPASGVYVPSAEDRADIPPLYLALYMRAAARFGLDWTILAGIGRVECDHGRDPAPSCTVEGQLNYAGAGGPAQFLVSTC